jgi:predicted phosphodiesterase
MPDLHAPYHSELAFATWLAVIPATRPDRIVIMGDAVDFYAVSSHSKRPSRRRDLQHEIAAALGCLDRIERAAAAVGAQVDYCEGNHENRLERYLCDRAPELYGLVTARDLLRVRERGWRWHPYHQAFRIGKMAYVHDLDYAGPNATTQSLEAFGNNVTFGHTHRGQVIYGGTAEGNDHVGITCGWLGDFDEISYTSPAKARRHWQHGFSWQMQDATGVTWAQFVPIINGRCIVDGQVISGRKRGTR